MKSKLLYIALLCTGAVYGQDSLSLNAAIELMLKGSEDIQILSNNAQIAKNDYSIGNAGMLPQVNFNAGYNYANNNINQRFTNGTEINQNGVASSNIGADITAYYVLFNGLRAQKTYKRLGEQSALSETQLKAGINDQVATVMAAYFDVLREQQGLRTLEDNFSIYEERVKIADTRFTLGSSSKTDLLQAKIDLNEQRTLIIDQRTSLATAKNRLNQILSRPAETAFSVQEIAPSLDSLNYDSVKTSVYRTNLQIQAFQRNINIAKYNVDEFKSLYYPMLAVAPSYQYNRSSSQAGFSLYNQSYGFNGGITLSWNLFNGLNTRRQVTNAKIVVENNNLQLQDYKTELNAGLATAWVNYTTAHAKYLIEKDNTTLAKENVDIMLERFRVGNCTTIDLKLAQQTMQDAQNRYILAGYQIKVAETELLRLSGSLVK